MECNMFKEIIRGLVLVGVLTGSVTPVVFAADAPKTRVECKKHKDMMWDGNACVLKKK